tara:strand:+ start:531 stop:1019 length:489 start_codon:yes stop_codon:yes gene_type:complete
MGRPIRIQKGNITAHGGSSNGHSTGGLGGTGSGLIEVTGAFFTSLTGLDSTITVSTANGMFISKQKSTKKFNVVGTAVDGSTTSSEALTLTAKAPGALSSGEFCVQAIGDDSTVYYVHKFHNRGVSVSSDGGSNFKFFGMDVLAEGTDEGQASSGFVNVDTQ